MRAIVLNLFNISHFSELHENEWNSSQSRSTEKQALESIARKTLDVRQGLSKFVAQL